MSYVLEKEFVHFMIKGGNLIEHRFMSDPSLWPKKGRLYALAIRKLSSIARLRHTGSRR